MISRPLTALLCVGFLAGAGCGDGSVRSLDGAVAGMSLTPTGDPGSGRVAPDPDRVDALLARPAPDTAAARVALDHLDEGLDRWRQGDHREGARRVDEALGRLPTLADWRPLIRAELLAAGGDTTGVREALEELDPAGTLYRRWGWEHAVDAFLEADDEEGAWNQARRGAQALDSGDEAGAAWLRAGRLSLSLGDTVRARGELVRALTGGDPRGPAGRGAGERLHRLDLEADDDLELRVDLVRALLAAGTWDGARERGESLVRSGTLGPEVEDEIRLGLGRALVELNRTTEALELLSPVVARTNAAGEVLADALFWSGQAALSRGRHEEALNHFVEAGQRVPESSRGEEGLLLLLDRGPGGSGWTERVMAALFQVGIGSAPGELAAVRHGTRSFLDGDYVRAARTFEEYLEGARRGATRQQAAYWAALSHQRGGDGDRASELLQQTYAENPLSFYGTFAADRLEAPVLPGDLPPGPPPARNRSDSIHNALLRLRVHQRVPTSGSFNWELARLEEYFLERDAEAYDFAEALLDDGLPIQGVVLGRTIHRLEEEWNLRLLRIVHPFPYRDLIVREARARGLDPFFVAGLIRQESLFHPTIQSSAGAVGLMQLLPGTAREVAQAEGLRFSAGALGDPETNIRLGTAFLASMVQRFDGRAEDALSAYNAGPTRARQWRSRPEYRDTHVFLEHIPFRETRHYVKVVQQYTRIYTALYGCGNFEPCLGHSYRSAVAQSGVAGGAPSPSLAR